MKRNLQVKFLIILAVMLVCLYGIIGIPKNKAELVENWHKNIRLGLDLRGGSHLVIQVQEQDAFNADAGHGSRPAEGRGEEGRRDDCRDGSPGSEDACRTPAKVAILVKGVPSTQAGQFRTLVNDQFTQWVLTGLNANDYRLTVKPSSAIQMRQEILAQTRSTIEKKINALGLSESSVQQRRGDAEAELLVQLPGVDDPARIKQILQTAAVLELYDGSGRPLSDQGSGAGPDGRGHGARHQVGGQQCERCTRGTRQRRMVFGSPDARGARAGYSGRAVGTGFAWAAAGTRTSC